jgi:hypothetical protein
VPGMSKHPAKRARQLGNLKPPKPQPGNRHRVTHGGRAAPSPRRQAAVEAQICEQLPIRGADGAPPPHDLIVVRLLAITLVRIESCAEYISGHGQFYKGGRPRPAVAVEDKLIARAANLADKLGLSPTSRAKMNLDLVHGQVSLAQLMSDHSEGQRTPDDHTIEGTAVDDDD